MKVFWSFVLILVLISCAASELAPAPSTSSKANGAIVSLLDVTLSADNSTSQSLESQALIDPSQISLTPTTRKITDSGGKRYLNVTFEFLNSTGNTLTDLTFFALSTPQSLGGTAFKNFNGGAADNNVLAVQVEAIHGRKSDAITDVDDDNAHFQAFKPSDITSVQNDVNALGLTGTYKVLPYGFVAQNENDLPNGGINRSIANGEKGRVTFAVRYPSITVTSMSMNFVVAEFGKTRFTRGRDESTGNVANRVNVFFPRPAPNLSPQDIPADVELFFIGDFDPLDIPEPIRNVVTTDSTPEITTSNNFLTCDSEVTLKSADGDHPATISYFFEAKADQVINVAHVMHDTGQNATGISAFVLNANGDIIGATGGDSLTETDPGTPSLYYSETDLMILAEDGLIEILVDHGDSASLNKLAYVLGLACIDSLSFVFPATTEISGSIDTLGDMDLYVFEPEPGFVELGLSHDAQSELHALLRWNSNVVSDFSCEYGLQSSYTLIGRINTSDSQRSVTIDAQRGGSCDLIRIGANPLSSGSVVDARVLPHKTRGSYTLTINSSPAGPR